MKEFQQRRARLMNQLGDGVLLMAGAVSSTRNSDVDYPFRQDSDFFYLTGFSEPDSFLIIENEKSKLRTTLLVPPKDKVKEIWNGKRAGEEGAVAEFGVDEAFSNADLETVLKEKLQGREVLFYEFSRDFDLDHALLDILRELREVKRADLEFVQKIQFYGRSLWHLRQLKGSYDLEKMKEAVRVTANANEKVLGCLKPGMNEAEIYALLEYEYMKSGHTSGYGSIVAGGANATILHYTSNNAPLRPETMLLIDSGCEVDLFSADVTRCYPVDGKYTDEARQIYSIVLEANKRAIAQCKPGSSIDQVHEEAKRVLSEGLESIGLQSSDGLDIDKFYMHRTSHWLGMDVHDVGRYQKNGEPFAFKPGMILTVEPGLYFNPDFSGVKTPYDGIGVRIEDDILITEDGYLNLSQAIPKEMDEIEEKMKEIGS